MASDRVVGKNDDGKRYEPGCNDVIFALLFAVNLVAIVVLFFAWVGDGAEGFPTGTLNNAIDSVADTHSDTGQPTSVASASVLTCVYATIFGVIWVFVYLLIMRVAALFLIIALNVLLIIIWIGFGIGCFYNASTCKERDQIPCTGALESEYYGSIIGGVLLCAVGALHALWLCCVRARIYFTAKLLQAVSTVLGWCPGTIIISVLLSLLTVVWYILWYGAFLQSADYLTGGTEVSGELVGSFVGLLFGLFVALFWGHKVFFNIAHMTSCHVIASWYFEPESAGEGIPCCRPVTCVGLKRSLLNYIGSIAFGSLLVAILEAVYWTAKFVLDRVTDGQNMLVKMIACCVLCIINCIKNTVEWLTEWAFVYIAIYGDNFVTAGGKVAAMLGQSGMGAIAQSTLVYPVLNVGRLIGVAIGVGSGFLTLQTFILADQWPQPVIGGIAGFAVVSVALSCVDAGNKCVYVCYVEAPELLAQRIPELSEAFAADERNQVQDFKRGITNKVGTVEQSSAQAEVKEVEMIIKP